MINTQIVGLGLKAMILVAVLTGLVMYHNNTEKDQFASFNVTPQEMLRDVDGKMAQLPYGQVWPFDIQTQGLTMNVMAKRQNDGFVVVLVEVKGTADVPKDPAKEGAKATKEKAPSRVRLGGYAKLTYENIGQSWYLMGVDSVSLRATPD